MTPRIAVGIAALIALTACADGDRPPRAEPTLIGGSTSSADTIEAAVIRKQRDLVRALAEDDSTSVGQLLSTRFVALDLRPGIHAADSDGAPGPLELGYFEVLAGALQERVDSVYVSYHATHRAERATVTAFAVGVDEGVRTTWKNGANGWAATHLLITSADEARRLMEQSR